MPGEPIRYPPRTLDIAAIVPGGVRPSDHVHKTTNDGSCSRCRMTAQQLELIGYDAPLMLFWGADMLIYCEGCLGGQD